MAIEEPKRMIEYSFGGILGLIIASYIKPYLANNIMQIIAGGALILAGTKFIKGTEGYKGPLKLGLVLAGTVFAVSGILSFVPSIKSQVDALTYGVL